MLKVFAEANRVIIDLGGRVRDTLLTCSDAEELEQALKRMATQAEINALAGFRSLIRNEQWGAKVISYDRRVAIRFFPPAGSTATRVPFTIDAARKMADQIKFTREQATYGIRFKTDRAL